MFFGALRVALWPTALKLAAEHGGHPSDFCRLLEGPPKVMRRSGEDGLSVLRSLCRKEEAGDVKGS